MVAEDIMSGSGRKARVLIVEDEWAIAGQIEATVSDAGFEVLGPFGDIDSALATAEIEDVSAALLDVELGPGIEVYPVADALRDRRIPYAFVTSKLRGQIAPAHADRPVVSKPFQPFEIQAVLNSLLQAGG
jgi:DNA-binding response OmpR family regulator